ncbi:MAG TPA: AraC family transcriptional regulator [Burkholderiales bacterium]|nr:AraC family transcriptional regulator [Burkholderiales bacterium]
MRPVYLVDAVADHSLSVARWRVQSFRGLREAFPQSVLVFYVAGSALVTRIAGGRVIRKRTRAGTVSFCIGDGRSERSVEGTVESMHVYLRRETLLDFAQQHLTGGAVPEIDDFLAIEDAWLAGYFRMLISELEVFEGVKHPADSLLLGETEHLLIRHLARWHSNARERDRREMDLQVRVNPLRPAIMRRVEEHVMVNLASDIPLKALAGVACMSVDHFLRSFRAAAGTTPHRFVLDKRLLKAKQMLKSSDAPIAAIATACGFRNPSHFSVQFRAHFGISPSVYRRSE